MREQLPQALVRAAPRLVEALRRDHGDLVAVVVREAAEGLVAGGRLERQQEEITRACVGRLTQVGVGVLCVVVGICIPCEPCKLHMLHIPLAPEVTSRIVARHDQQRHDEPHSP